MFGVARRSTSTFARTCTRNLSASLSRWEGKRLEDIFPEGIPTVGNGDHQTQPTQWQPWAERMQADRTQTEPLEAGTATDNPHLQAIYDMAKTQHVEQDFEMDAARPTIPTDSRMSASLRLPDIPTGMTKEHVFEMFSPFGEISDVRLDMIRGQRVGMVTFRNSGAADAAVNANEFAPFMFGDEELTLRYGSFTRLNPPSKTLFLTNYHDDDREGLRERLVHLFSPFAEVTGIRFASRNNSCFLDFGSVEEARAIIEQHEARPFRDQNRILRVNYDLVKTQFPPHYTLCITGYTGNPLELEDYFPVYGGGNHIEQMFTVEDRARDRPPQYFLRFENLEYAIKAYEALQDDFRAPFRISYARAPNHDKGKRREDDRRRRGFPRSAVRDLNPF